MAFLEVMLVNLSAQENVAGVVLSRSRGHAEIQGTELGRILGCEEGVEMGRNC